jgi:hypothetical protein
MCLKEIEQFFSVYKSRGKGLTFRVVRKTEALKPIDACRL